MYIQIVMYNYFNGKTSMNALGDRLLSQGLSVARRSLERSLLRRSLASLCSSDSAGRRSLERPLG